MSGPTTYTTVLLFAVEMFNKLSENSNVIFSMKTKTVCGECNFITNEKIHKYVPMRFVGEWKTIIGDIQAFTELDSFNSEICPKCSILLDSRITYNDVLHIHIEMAYPDALPHLIEMEKISNYILLSDKLYEFRAAVPVQYTSNHFIAHIKRNDDVWQTYDDLKSSVQKPTKSFYSVQYYYAKIRMNLDEIVHTQTQKLTCTNKINGICLLFFTLD